MAALVQTSPPSPVLLAVPPLRTKPTQLRPIPQGLQACIKTQFSSYSEEWYCHKGECFTFYRHHWITSVKGMHIVLWTICFYSVKHFESLKALCKFPLLLLYYLSWKQLILKQGLKALLQKIKNSKSEVTHPRMWTRGISLRSWLFKGMLFEQGFQPENSLPWFQCTEPLGQSPFSMWGKTPQKQQHQIYINYNKLKEVWAHTWPCLQGSWKFFLRLEHCRRIFCCLGGR